MLSSVDLEVMDSVDPHLNWKIVTKGRRSRTSIARRKKLSAAISGQPTSGKADQIPLKKRRNLLRSPSPQPRTPSICRLDSSSQPYSSSPLFEDFEDNDAYPSHFPVLKSASSYSNWKLRDGSASIKFVEGFDYEVLSEQTGREHNYVEDFSGIELLAAAASMDDDADIASKEDLVVGDSLMPKCSDISNLDTQFNQDSECNIPFSNETVHEDDSDRPLVWNDLESASQSALGCVGDQTMTRADSLVVDRRHWDLNTLMDAWDEPYYDSIAGKISKDVANDDMHVEGRQECSEYQLLCNPAIPEDKLSNVIVEENKLVAVSPRGICIEFPSLEEPLPEPANICKSNASTRTSDQDTEKNVDYPYASRENIDSLAASVEKIESPATSAAKTNSHIVSPEKVDLHMTSAANFDPHMGSAEKIDSYMAVDVRNDSPYEDGELRGSFLYNCEENELENQRVDYESDGRHGDGSDAGDLPGSEIVDGGSEGSHSSARKSLLTKRFLGSNESNRRAVQHSFVHFMEDEPENNDGGGKNKSEPDLVIGEDVDESKRRFSDQLDAVDDTVTHMDEYLLRTIQSKVQSCSKTRSSLDAFDGKDIFFMQQCRSRRPGGSDSRAEKDMCPYKYLRYRHANHKGEKGGEDQWTYWGSRSHYTSNYQGADRPRFNKPRRITGDSVDKFDRLDFDHKRQNTNYLSKGCSHRSLVGSSPMGRDDCVGVRRRMPLTQGIRENYPQCVGKKFEPLPDNASKSVRRSPYLSSRERGFSQSSGRGFHIPLTHRRSRSRSRTRSPMAWHSNRARDLGTRRRIRSPDFRSEARVDRTKLLNSNSTFESDYREGYLSPSRGRFSPQRNSRWFDDLSFADNHLRRQRSPVRFYRRSQRFDAIGSSGRLKSDDYFKPTIRPGRSSFLSTDGREGEFETDYEHRRHDDRGKAMHRRRDADDGGNSRRFRQSAEADVLETISFNNDDDIPGTDPRDVPQR